jgi:hypothetical protein
MKPLTLTRSTSRALTSLALMAILVVALIGLPVRVADAAARLVFTRKQPTTAAMKLVDGNAERSSVMIQNVGSVTAFVSNLSTVTTSTGVSIAPNQRATFVGVSDQLYGITASSTADLRITETIGSGGSMTIERLNTSGISNGASTNETIPCSDGTNLAACNALIYVLSTAITANSTSTATAAGTLAITSNATGRGSIFYSDASKWQLLTNYAQYNSGTSDEVTIATTSTTDMYLSAPVTGSLTGIDFSSLDALAADDTNYITFTVVNLGQSGGGSTAMLAVSDANTTKTTGGTAITALARRTLTVHGTASNLLVVKGDVIRVRATATGTLAGTVTRSRAQAYFTRSV